MLEYLTKCLVTQKKTIMYSQLLWPSKLALTTKQLGRHCHSRPIKVFFALAWWQTCSCCLLSKNGGKKLTESQPACPETYLRASVCVAPWAEPHGRRVNEAQVQLIRGRRSVACNNKGRKCRNMTWNTKLQNKMKQIGFYLQLDGVSRCRSDKRGKFSLFPFEQVSWLSSWHLDKLQLHPASLGKNSFSALLHFNFSVTWHK